MFRLGSYHIMFHPLSGTNGKPDLTSNVGKDIFDGELSSQVQLFLMTDIHSLTPVEFFQRFFGHSTPICPVE